MVDADVGGKPLDRGVAATAGQPHGRRDARQLVLTDDDVRPAGRARTTGPEEQGTGDDHERQHTPDLDALPPVPSEGTACIQGANVTAGRREEPTPFARLICGAPPLRPTVRTSPRRVPGASESRA